MIIKEKRQYNKKKQSTKIETKVMYKKKPACNQLKFNR